MQTICAPVARTSSEQNRIVDKLHSNNSCAEKKRPCQLHNDFTLCDNNDDTCVGINIYTRSSPNRQPVESYIAEVFKKCHNAKLVSFMPDIFGLSEEKNQLSAAVGICKVGRQSAFIEQYFDYPIEHIVSNIAEQPVQRPRLVEVGNLAVTNAGNARKLIAFLVYYLNERGFHWAVCTAASSVRAALRRTDIEYQLIQQADPQKLGGNHRLWGNYYRHKPFVLAIDIRSALHSIQNRYVYMAHS